MMYIEHNHPELLEFYDTMGNGKVIYYSDMNMNCSIFGTMDMWCTNKPEFYSL